MFKQLSLFDSPVVANEAINDSYTENKPIKNVDTSNHIMLITSAFLI